MLVNPAFWILVGILAICLLRKLVPFFKRIGEEAARPVEEIKKQIEEEKEK